MRGVEYQGVPAAVVPGAIEIPANAASLAPAPSVSGYSFYYKTAAGDISLATGTSAVVILNTASGAITLVVRLPLLSVATLPVYLKVLDTGIIRVLPSGSDKIDMAPTEYDLQPGVTDERGMLIPDRGNGTWWIVLAQT